VCRRPEGMWVMGKRRKKEEEKRNGEEKKRKGKGCA
jgi:hypothetical protein